MSEYDPIAFDAFEEVGWGTKEAAHYDALAGRVTSRLADPLLDAVGAGPGKRVLDIATGPGYVAARAAERGADSVGLDFSEFMLAHARRGAPSVDFVHGNATALPFPDGSFAAATCAFLLLHLGRPEKAVTEAARVLAPDGRAAFSVWDEPSRSRWLGVVLDAITAAGAHPPADVPPGPRSSGSRTTTSSPGCWPRRGSWTWPSRPSSSRSSWRAVTSSGPGSSTGPSACGR